MERVEDIADNVGSATGGEDWFTGTSTREVLVQPGNRQRYGNDQCSFEMMAKYCSLVWKSMSTIMMDNMSVLNCILQTFP